MSNFNYQEDAKRTVSEEFFPELVSRRAFENTIMFSISFLEVLDKIKKSLFYGVEDDVELSKKDEIDLNSLDLSKIHHEPQKAKDILHGILGKATEAGELLEALFKTLGEGEQLDLVNIEEEIGDGCWYDALLANSLDTTLDAIQRKNIAKLKKRFPEKFTCDKANNRNLEAERKVLEKS